MNEGASGRHTGAAAGEPASGGHGASPREHASPCRPGRPPATCSGHSPRTPLPGVPGTRDPGRSVPALCYVGRCSWEPVLSLRINKICGRPNSSPLKPANICGPRAQTASPEQHRRALLVPGAEVITEPTAPQRHCHPSVFIPPNRPE